MAAYMTCMMTMRNPRGQLKDAAPDARRESRYSLFLLLPNFNHISVREYSIILR